MTRRAHGISLVELMIGMTIGMIALLVMVQTFSVSSGHKANTVSGADATTAGHIALNLLERDLRNAGSGLSFVSCPEIRVYNSANAPSVTNISAMPVTIEENTDSNTPSTLRNRSDRITIRYSESAEVGATSTITDEMPNPSANLRGSTDIGFSNGDLILVFEPGKPCVMLQLTKKPNLIGGARWNFQHNSGASGPHNPPGAPEGFFPTDGFRIGVGKILSLGSGVNEYRYQLHFRDDNTNVPNADLEWTQIRNGTAGEARALTRDVIALRAQYGWWDSAANEVTFSSTIPAGAGPKELAAVRVGIVVRASQRDRSYTAPSSIKLFEFDNPITITLAGDELNYRYRTFETVVSLRNTIWNR
jgi:type IV pilus assembly protein PilW